MKASERLRELDGEMRPRPWRETGWSLVDWDAHGRDRDALLALRNALPLIADVVEAAERAEAWVGSKELDALRDALEEK